MVNQASSVSPLRKIFGATVLIMGVTVFSRLMGFIRELFMAAKYGTSMEADAFVAAFTIPTLLLTIIGGALSATLIPLIIKLKTENHLVRIEKLLGSVFVFICFSLTSIAISLYFLMDEFVKIYVSGFSPEGLTLTAEMLIIILPAFVLIGLIGFLSAILNASQHYLAPAMGSLFYNGGIIIGLVYFSSQFGVQSLMVGMAVGISVHFLILIVVNIYKKNYFKPHLTINQDLKQFARLIFPIFLSMAAFQVNFIVDRMMGSTLDEGSLAALNYAQRVTQLPQSIFVGALVLPLLPVVAEQISKHDMESTNRLLLQCYRLIAIVLFPIMAVLIILPEPIISILFQRGQFDIQSVHLTSTALVFYSLTLFSFAMRDIMTRTFYALHDTWTPVVNNLILVALNIGFMLILVPRYGIIGIAGSTSLAAFIAYIRLRFILNKKLSMQNYGRQQTNAWRQIILNVIIFSAVVYSFYHLGAQILTNPSGWHLWVRTLSSFILGSVVYLLLVFRLNTEEVIWLKERLRLTKRKTH
ncbi:putative peptidoglycan lipid II flippase [Caldalkalibacillus uzonensis]|uniref:Probable lipid II flippase MurJ n=1 Tax=Caldalkalibacillus uzonensis TaxID=353224 RepID=A0ABU0CQ27_9BACI|nr:murein biosynthesis integral membrane protein MurJ [Caldalkalibacillus uzonensis]MDQ0338495.1 putative peptidoglycan lipid II flippase [Caldalkalibacillus uzonensis]